MADKACFSSSTFEIPEWCNHPEYGGRTCRGCEESLNPALFDGGCKRLFREGEGECESLKSETPETVLQPRVNFRKIQGENLGSYKKTEG